MPPMPSLGGIGFASPPGIPADGLDSPLPLPCGFASAGLGSPGFGSIGMPPIGFGSPPAFGSPAIGSFGDGLSPPAIPSIGMPPIGFASLPPFGSIGMPMPSPGLPSLLFSLVSGLFSPAFSPGFGSALFSDFGSCLSPAPGGGSLAFGLAALFNAFAIASVASFRSFCSLAILSRSLFGLAVRGWRFSCFRLMSLIALIASSSRLISRGVPRRCPPTRGW